MRLLNTKVHRPIPMNFHVKLNENEHIGFFLKTVLTMYR